MGLDPDDCRIEIRCYGWNAVLGDRDPDPTPPREVGAMLLVTAADQATATQVVKLANPYLLHMPLPDMEHLPELRVHGLAGRDRTGAALRVPAQPRRPPRRARRPEPHRDHGGRAAR